MLSRYLVLPVAVLGDIIVLTAALFTALSVRSLAIPRADFFGAHTEPFLIILFLSILVFFVTGLYDIFSIAHVRSLLSKIGAAQLANTVISIIFFYAITVWGITPKTTLALYAIISTLFLIIWRAGIFPRVVGKMPKENALLIAEEGGEGRELYGAISIDTPYPLFVSDMLVDTDSRETTDKITAWPGFGTATIIVDTRINLTQELTETIYEHIGQGGNLRDFTNVYEEVFGKIPESSLTSENILPYVYDKHKGYDVLKRIMDVAIALPLFVVSLLLYPFVYLGIKVQDGGPVFFTHDRMGRGGKRISIYKFRSMTFGDTRAVWVQTEGNANKVTQFGKFIRKTRIDELPQLWNVLRGDISLIGPRPDLWALATLSDREIPFYKARLSVLPGLSGWAQTQMHAPPQNIEETKERLLHDIYYIKHRSLSLDILIALKTIKTLLGREGM
jgi:lipopolysaccharide/colanic/teichoic acid biosynthesis glycosyltransferase